jgi:hypothetical protein
MLLVRLGTGLYVNPQNLFAQDDNIAKLRIGNSMRRDRDWLLANGYDENGNRRGVYKGSGTHRAEDVSGDGTQGFKFALASLVLLTGLIAWSWKKIGPVPTIIILSLLTSLLIVVTSLQDRKQDAGNSRYIPPYPSSPNKSKLPRGERGVDSREPNPSPSQPPVDDPSQLLEPRVIETSRKDAFVTPSNSRFRLDSAEQNKLIQELDEASR